MATYADIEIADIVICRPRREPDDQKVKTLADSIRTIGLQHPIGVTADNRLIHGRHRLEAYRLLGHKSIPAMIHEMNDLQAELAEIDENIQRSQLTALEEAQALKRRKAIYEKLHPQTKQHRAGGHARHGSAGDKLSFAEDAAETTGKGRRTIERAVAIAHAIPEHLQSLIADTPIANNKRQLETLARLSSEEQCRVSQRLASGAARTVEQAIAEGPHEQENSAEPAKSTRPPICPTCEHSEFDPEDGDCLRCHEPGVVPPRPTATRSDKDLPAEDLGEDIAPADRPDRRLEITWSRSLDRSLDDLQQVILQHVNAWREEHLACPWPVVVKRVQSVLNDVCKNLAE